MNPKTHAVRVGLRRGWTEFKQSVRSPQDQAYYVFSAVGVLVYMFFIRNSELEGTDLLMPTFAMPSVLAAVIVFSALIGPGYALAMEREDGTLLRAKAVPYGMTGQVTGHLVLNILGVVPTLAIILIPSYLLFGVAPGGAAGWWTVAWVTALGLLATLPIGIVLGSVVPGVQKMGTWGMLPFAVLVGISGIFVPITTLWGWVQGVAQFFPLYWVGLGMRSAFLPDAALVLELGESWRTPQTVLVLVLWAIAGFILAPVVLRRMARRQSGSQVEAAREAALQWVR